jgi:hypothetical protein
VRATEGEGESGGRGEEKVSLNREAACKDPKTNEKGSTRLGISGR